MDDTTRNHLKHIATTDRDLQNTAYSALMEATEKPVEWAYEAWDDLVAFLTHKDNHVRAIAAQLLNNLAKSDPQNRMQATFPALLNVTKDERFVTARHCMQSLWKIGLAGNAQKQQLLAGLEQRYHECISEKNGTLIRYDIIEDFKKLYDAAPDEAIRTKALALIETEADLKYRKKYAGLWKPKK